MKNRMISTRGGDAVSIDDAIQLGLARDGGLFVPERFPQYQIESFYDFDFTEFALHLLKPFFVDSAIHLDSDFCREVFSFPLPLHQLSDTSYALELFHGPTLSFKDFGARFFAQCLQELMQGKRTTVLVATSGDTGSAVASALHGKEGIRGVILFPKDKISQRQQAQIACWGDNIHAVAVEGTFDACQKLVKTAFAEGMAAGESLTTANSINIARLLPQILFYAYSSIQLWKQHHQLVDYIVPCGNFGNVTACYWAKRLGFPIGTIRSATNENAVVEDFLATGIYRARPSIKTLANAMDVGDPSNLERLRYLFSGFAELQKNLDVVSVHDAQIKAAILDCYNRYHYIICPHTATAYHRLNQLSLDKPTVIVATAHPAKFEEIIEPLLNVHLEIPEQLEQLLMRPQHIKSMTPNTAAMQKLLNWHE